MRKSQIIISVAIIMFAVLAAILFLSSAKEYMDARKRAQPIVAMLRQGTIFESIGKAVNAISGHRYVTDTNAVTGEVRHTVVEKLPDFEPLSKMAAKMVQTEIIRVLPSLAEKDALSCIFLAILNFEGQGTLDLTDADWQIVEAAVDRYSRQQKPDQGGFGIVVSEDGTKQMAIRGPILH
jgi:hypothetical protein